VVDPTASWGEMGGHPRDVNIASFEPGIAKAPYTVANKFLSLGSTADSARFRARMSGTQSMIDALHKAGIPIVAGSDRGLVGYGLLREIEIYVQSGLTPLEAIQSATIVPARAMHLGADSGTVEAGKGPTRFWWAGPRSRISATSAKFRAWWPTGGLTNRRNCGRAWDSTRGEQTDVLFRAVSDTHGAGAAAGWRRRSRRHASRPVDHRRAAVHRGPGLAGPPV